VSLAAVLLLSSVILVPAPGDTVRFSVLPAEVFIGDTVTLSWDAPGASSVFITGVGMAPPSGTARLVPGREETTYLLSAEYAQEAQLRTATVRVNGARGDGPDLVDMEFPYNGRCRPVYRSINRLRERVHELFQDSLLVEAQERRGPVDEIIVETRTGSQRVVPGSPERRIRSRRVYFRVRIAAGLREGLVVCSVSSNVQFQRAGESRWYPEPEDSELHALAARFLMERMRNE
jgi:hypothetical protein